MRGSITMEEAWQTCQEDREIVFGIIEENLEVTKKTKIPYF